MKKYLTLILISTNVLAVTPIKKGEVAKEDGFLFTPQEEQQLRQINEDRVRLEDLNSALNQKIELQERRIENYQDNFKKSYETNDMTKFLYFALGVVVTGAVSYGVYRTTK